jgi:hypothetical protein
MAQNKNYRTTQIAHYIEQMQKKKKKVEELLDS